MNHQPFETWILEDLKISKEEKSLLDDHLKQCHECYALQRSWEISREQLLKTPVKSAPTGFVPRWKVQFELRRKAKEQSQVRTLLISIGSGVIALSIVLSALSFPELSVISLLVGLLTMLVRLVNSLNTIWSLVLSLIHTATPTTLIIIGTLLAAWISLTTFVWGVSIWRITTKGVRAK